jgi:hypothetical protein
LKRNEEDEGEEIVPRRRRTGMDQAARHEGSDESCRDRPIEDADRRQQRLVLLRPESGPAAEKYQADDGPDEEHEVTPHARLLFIYVVAHRGEVLAPHGGQLLGGPAVDPWHAQHLPDRWAVDADDAAASLCDLLPLGRHHLVDMRLLFGDLRLEGEHRISRRLHPFPDRADGVEGLADLL